MYEVFRHGIITAPVRSASEPNPVIEGIKSGRIRLDPTNAFHFMAFTHAGGVAQRDRAFVSAAIAGGRITAKQAKPQSAP